MGRYSFVSSDSSSVEEGRRTIGYLDWCGNWDSPASPMARGQSSSFNGNPIVPRPQVNCYCNRPAQIVISQTQCNWLIPYCFCDDCKYGSWLKDVVKSPWPEHRSPYQSSVNNYPARPNSQGNNTSPDELIRNDLQDIKDVVKLLVASSQPCRVWNKTCVGYQGVAFVLCVLLIPSLLF